MAERWRQELGKLEGLEPPKGVIEDAKKGPRRSSSGPGGRSRLGAALVAFAVFAAAGVFAWRAFDPWDRGSTVSAHGAATYTDPLGWALDYPPAWNVVRIDTHEKASYSGAQFSNVPVGLPSASPPAPMQVNSSVLPNDGIALTITHRVGGPPADPSVELPRAPISVEQFSSGSAPAGGSTVDYLSFTVDDLPLEATIKTGPRATPDDIAAVESIVASIRPSSPKQSPQPTEAPPVNPAWPTYHDAKEGFSIQLPPHWEKSHQPLTGLIDPVEILSVGTFTMPKGGSCPQFPVNAIAELGAQDALITVLERKRIDPSVASPPARPPAFGPEDGSADDESPQCLPTEKRFFHRSITFSDQGRQFSVYVAMGLDVSEQRRSEVWGILDSLVFTPMQDHAGSMTTASASGPQCPQGQLIQVNRWQDVVERMRNLGELTRVDDPAAGWPHVDQYVVAPDDPTPFAESVPDGFVLVVNCAPESESGALTMLGSTGGFIPESNLVQRSRADRSRRG